MVRVVQERQPMRFLALAGRFASQPLAFAHLMDEAPDLALDQVEVIPQPAARRLGAYFDPVRTAELEAALQPGESILLLPAQPECGLEAGTRLLRPLGVFEGARLVARTLP